MSILSKVVAARLQIPASGKGKAFKAGLRADLGHYTRLRDVDKHAAPVLASDYIRHLTTLIAKRPWLKVVVYLRVSTRQQNKKRNLWAQKRWMLRELERLGVLVLRVYRETGSGWKDDRPVLKAAAEYAIANDSILVAETADRFLRSRDFKTTTPWVLPTCIEWEALKLDTGSVTLATVLHPDTDWKEARRHQSVRGRDEKGSKFGRPRKLQPGDLKMRHDKLMPRVRKFRETWGCSYREIAGLVDVPWPTIRDWLRPFKSRGV